MSLELEESLLIYQNKIVLDKLSKNISIYKRKNQGVFLEFSKDKNFSTAYWTGIKIRKMKRFTALFRMEPYWWKPFFGSSEERIPDRTTVILIERSDILKLILVPLIDKGYNFYLNGKPDGLEIMADNNCPTGTKNRLVGLYIGIGKDPYILLKEAAKAVLSYIKVGKLREEKNVPKWVKYLGYCTWNTFYHNITQENVIRMIHNLVKKNKINLGYLLLDDGWQISKQRTLINKGVNKKKFPSGLKEFINFIKSKFGIKYFLIWHTIQGYWFGLNLRGAYSKKFKKQLVKNRPFWGPSNPPIGTKINWIAKNFTNFVRMLYLKAGVLLPKDMALFWEDYHGWLASQGVDGVKVDNQSGTEQQCYGLGYQANLMREYHKVLEESVSKHFSKYSIINCMSQNTNVYYHLVESNITRNSQDYYPGRNIEQTQHVIINTYNNLWCGHFSLTDWDMFQTDHIWGEYQAASRAISGSPIYFADDYGKVKKEIISKIALPNGKLLLCSDIALPCRDIIFRNPAKPNRALKIFNHNKYNSVLGTFNAMVNNPTTVSYSPSDIEGLNQASEFAIFGIMSKSIVKMNYNNSSRITLKPIEFEIFTISEITNGFAPIGLINKYNPGGIFKEIQYEKTQIVITARYGGLFGFYCEKEPRKVINEAKEVEFKYNEETKLLKVIIPKSESQHIEIVL